MKKRIIEAIRELSNIQTCNFEYWPHLKPCVVRWHLGLCIVSLLMCYFHRYIGLLSVPCMISWDYFILFDKKRRAYKDDYKPQQYEYIGTIRATIISCVIIVGLILQWSKG